MQRERRDVGLLAAGSLVSMAGDSAALVALLLELRAAGVGWVSAALGAEVVPFVLLAHLSGRLVDRVDNRRLIVVALAGQALLAVPLGFARSPSLVVTLFFALNCVSTVVRPAANALVPAVSGELGATKGFAWVATGTEIGFIAGPALGGVLASTAGVTVTLGIDAATFLVTAAACALLSTTRRHEPSAETPEDRHGGLRIIRSDTVVFVSIVTTTIAVGCAVVDNVAAPFRFVDQLGTSSTGYGAYLAVWGVGALIGSQLPRRIGATRLSVALAVGNGISGLGIAGIGLAPSLAVALVASGLGGIGNGVASVSVNALVVDRVAKPQQGRAFAAVGALIQAGVGVGTAGGAPLVAVLGAGHAMVLAGATAVAVVVVTVGWGWIAAERSP